MATRLQRITSIRDTIFSPATTSQQPTSPHRDVSRVGFATALVNRSWSGSSASRQSGGGQQKGGWPQAATLPLGGRAARGGRPRRLARRLVGTVILAAAVAAVGFLAAWHGVADAQTQVGSVQVGEVPIFVRVSPDGRQAIVLNFFSTMNNIMVIDLASLRVVQNFSVGMRPQFADFAPNGQAIVGFDEALEVTFLDLNAGSVIQNVPVGNRPEAVRVDPSGGRALVANGLDGNLTIIDVATRQVLGTIEAGRDPRYITFALGGAIAVVANGRSNDLSVLDVAAGRQLLTIPVGTNPTSVELLPDLSGAVVTNGRDNTVSIVNAATLESTTIPVGCLPAQVALNPQGTLAFVANPGSNTVSVVSLVTKQVVASFDAGNVPQSLALTPDGTRLLVVNQLGNLLRIYDVSGITPTQAPVGGAPSACGGSRAAGSVVPDPPDRSGLSPRLFVDAAATPGGDGSAARPFRSITAALNASREGDVIFVAAGVYSPSLTGETIPIGVPTDELPFGPPENIALIGAGAETTVIDAEGATRFGNGNGVHLFTSGLRIEGFTVENAETIGIFIGGAGRLQNVRVANNLVRFSGNQGIGGQDVDGCVIANNVAVLNDGNGIALNNSTCAISGNTANNNVLDGILLGSGGTATISNNTMLNNGSSGFEANNRPIPPNPERPMRVRLVGNTANGNGGQQFATVGSGFLVTEGAVAEVITNNRAADNVTGGISIFQNGRANLIAANDSSGNRGEGILIRTGASVEVIASNTTSNNEQNGIFLDNSSRATVINGNVSSANKQSGLAVLVGSTVGSIANNTITNNTLNGIFVFQGSNASVTNNVIQDNGNSGIAADSGSTARAQGNTISGHRASAGLAGTNGGVIVAGANTLAGNALATFGTVQGGAALPDLSISPTRVETGAPVPLTLTATLPAGRAAVSRDIVFIEGVDVGASLLSLLSFDAAGQAGSATLPVAFTAAQNGAIVWFVETSSGAASAPLIVAVP